MVFDIGGVLLDWDPRHLYSRLIADAAERDRFLAEVCTMDWNLTLDRGRSFDDACADLAAEHPEHRELIDAWKRQDEMVAGEIPGVAAVVGRLRAAQVPLYLLTNMPSPVFRARVQKYEVLQGFHGAVVSGDEGVLKPSAEIFGVLATRFGLRPASTLFVDDSETNVRGAEALGFQAHHFRDAACLEATLTGLRLLNA